MQRAPGAAARQARTRRPAPASATGGRAVSARNAHERPGHLGDAALAAELVGEVARRVQRVQRVAGHDEVDERPDDGRRGGEREQVDSGAPRRAHHSQ